MAPQTADIVADYMMVETDHGIVTVSLVQLTPDRATELLAKNTNNRNVSKDNIAKLAKYLKDGAFYFNGATVVISDTGTIMDGQHRLLAIEQTGISAPILLVEGVHPDALATIDQGRPRTVSDILTLDGVQMKNMTIANSIARSAVLLGSTPGRGNLAKDRIYIADQVKADYDALALAANNAKTLTNLARNTGFSTARSFTNPNRVAVAPGVLGTLMYLMVQKGANPDHVEDFFRRIISGLPDPECPNIFLAARTRLITTAPLLNGDNDSIRTVNNYEVFIRAYNAWRAKRDMKRLQEPRIQLANSDDLTRPATN